MRSPASGIPGLSVEPVLSEPMIVALPLGHRLAQQTQQPLPLAELAHESFILYRRPAGQGCTTPSWPPATAPASARASCRKRRACRPPSAVGAGLGLSVVPGSMRRLGGDGIVYRTLAEEAQLSAPLYRAAPQPASPIVERFRQLVLETVGAS